MKLRVPYTLRTAHLVATSLLVAVVTPGTGLAAIKAVPYPEVTVEIAARDSPAEFPPREP